MRVPQTPPDLDRVRESMVRDSPEKYIDLISRLETIRAVSDEYSPWEKIRFKRAPVGLTNEQWWLLIKLSRAPMQRVLPLFAKDGGPFTYALPDAVLRVTEEISRRASGQIAVPEQVTNSATRDRYIVSSLIEESITSSQLEGATTSRRVAKEMLRSGRPARDTSEKMITNNYAAMRYVSGLDDKTLTPALVCSIQRLVTDGTLEDPASAGRIQTAQDQRVSVFDAYGEVLHVPPPAAELPDRLAALCEFANGGAGEYYIHPVLRALTVHFMIGYDHYFEDGNGRTARALFYLVMLREGYWLTEFLAISRILATAPSKYARSYLLSEQDGGDLTYFFLYHLDVIRRAIEDFDKYLERKVAELRETRLLLSTSGQLNHRQLALLELALKDSGSRFTVASHATSHGVSEETARHDLMDLATKRLLVRHKEARKFVWWPSPKINEEIRSGAR